MKPFDLGAAQNGGKIVTRDGREAKFLVYVPEADGKYKVVALVDRYIHTYMQSGEFIGNGEHRDMDLCMYEAPKKVQWVNIYDSTVWGGVVSRYDSEKAADENSASNRWGGKAHRIEV